MVLLALVATQTWAQNFEGTIKWTMKMEITDPKLKAEMADAQQKMNDPKMQAEMKKAQEAMNDPKMKAMMEANPQMKEMMEKRMKMMQGGGGDMMSNMMPKGMIMKVKDGNSLVVMDGGMMKGEILNLKDKTVHLDRENKTYSVMNNDMEAPPGMEMSKPTVTKTSETAKIAGYNCTKYTVTVQEYGQTMSSQVWTTTEIAGIDMKAMAKRGKGKGPSMFYEGMDGVPMKVVSTTAQGTMVMEVVEVKKGAQKAADFTIPSDYKETKGMFGR